MNIAKFSVVARKFMVDNSPLLLTTLGVAGSILTTYQTGRATFKAAKLIQDRQFEINLREETRHDLTNAEKTKLVWQEYILPASTLGMTCCAIIYANRVSTRRMAALAAAYSLTEKNVEEYKNKIIEKMGGNKEQAARDELAQDRLNKNPPTASQIVMVGGGDILCFDQFTGRYFKSDMESIRRAENDTNRQMLQNGYASLSDFYERVGLPPTSLSEEVGWNSDKKLELKFSSVIASDGKPCISFDFDVSPIRNYGKCWGD